MLFYLILGILATLSYAISHPRYADESDWTPLLYPYQQTGANVLFFTFIDPRKMVVPLAFRKLGNIRGFKIVFQL